MSGVLTALTRESASLCAQPLPAHPQHAQRVSAFNLLFCGVYATLQLCFPFYFLISSQSLLFHTHFRIHAFILADEMQ